LLAERIAEGRYQYLDCDLEIEAGDITTRTGAARRLSAPVM
jgi:hypothetical protein